MLTNTLKYMCVYAKQESKVGSRKFTAGEEGNCWKVGTNQRRLDRSDRFGAYGRIRNCSKFSPETRKGGVRVTSQ